MINERAIVTDEEIDHILDNLRGRLEHAMAKKGGLSFASSHEMLGALTEEFHEVIDAVRADNGPQVHSELLDVGVVAVFGMASLLAQWEVEK